MPKTDCVAITAVVLLAGGGSLHAQRSWSQVPTTGGPSARVNHAAAYDLGRSRLVVFGGSDGMAVHGDTWEWDGQTWWLRTPATSPPARCAHSMAYSLTSGRVVLFGGTPDAFGTQSLDDTWEWDGNNWTLQQPATRPAARLGAAMCADTNGGVALFGGRNSAQQAFQELWHWDGTNWSLLASTGPPARCCHDLACDLGRGRLVLFGGWNGVDLGDTWEWDGSSWSQSTGPAPATRWGHRMAFDLGRAVTVLHGGHTGGDESWEWNGVTWTQVATTPSLIRHNQVMAFDVVDGRVALFGGYNGVSNADLWTFGVPVTGGYVPFGSGCAGTAGTPQLSLATAQPPAIGRSFGLRGTAVPGFALLFFGWSITANGPTPLPLDLTAIGMPGCRLLVSTDAVLTGFGVQGVANWNLHVPYVPRLAGLVFHNQVFAFDAAANALGLTSSNGATGTIGRP